jgi:hypothetical protein
LGEEFDLFGMPIDPGTGKPGRPKKTPTPEMRSKIKELLSLGWSNERLAGVAGMSLPTFRRNFFQELKARDFAMDRLKAWRLNRLITLGNAGNVAALKEVGKIIEQAESINANRDLTKRQTGRLDDGAPVGKKVAAKIAAMGVGSDPVFGDLLTPAGRKGKAH